MINKMKALKSLRPNSEWVMLGNTIQWLDEETLAPTEKEITAEIERLQLEEETAKQAAQAKLATLGLTTNDLKMLLGK